MINKKAPRLSKSKFSTIVFDKKLWRRFKKEYPNFKDISWKEFKQRWLEITETIRNEVVMNPLGVKLPLYLGELKYQYLPYKYKGVDIDESEKQNKLVYHVNLTTRGKIAKIKWDRRWAVRYFKMLQLYAFENHREINKISKDYTIKHPEKIRISRAITGFKHLK